MELIRPSVEIWEQNNSLDGVWAHIARCTRVCYQSTPKNNGETNEEFVKRVILRPDSSTGELNFDNIHGAMLEHGTVYLKFTYTDNVEEFKKCSKYFDNKYSRVLDLRRFSHNTGEGSVYVYDRYVTTNLRVIYENDWLDDLQYICSPTKYHAKRITVSFITNIGVTREFNRHRVNSMAEESTRYCNYNKRNDGQINFAIPSWLSENGYLNAHKDDDLFSYINDFYNYVDDNDLPAWLDIDYYLFALTVCEFCYNMLIKKGWKPQQAREVLPLATKSQLIHTAFVDDWKHFFALRADGVSGPPHPNVKHIANQLKEEFIKRGYI